MAGNQSPMVGQWTQFFRGGNCDFIIFNVDCDAPKRGVLSIGINNCNMPISVSITQVNGTALKGSMDNPKGIIEGEFIRKNLLKGFVKFAGNIRIDFKLTKGQLGKSSLKPISDVKSWDNFKKWAGKNGNVKGKIFRGQKECKQKLSTSFHRKERYDLFRYCSDDVRKLAYYINAVSDHYFDIDRQDVGNKVVGALLNLAQHHGFPTPFLDWTESPYIAAYFAYENLGKKDGHYIRIFVFDKNIWGNNHKPVTYDLKYPGPNMTVRVPEIVNNDRALPQQSVVISTNIADIESFISENEKQDKDSLKGKTYLQCIDLPANERFKVMKELRQMGIHAGSMFPGLEGICKSLREKNFPFPE